MAMKISTKQTGGKTAKNTMAINKPAGPEMETGSNKQRFSFTAPEAMSVQLVGDFTQWHEKPISLQKNEDGIWQATVELAPGMHHYRFLVDGQWRDDPECAFRAPNPFGSEDMVRKVA